jgi:hypothetical protein
VPIWLPVTGARRRNQRRGQLTAGFRGNDRIRRADEGSSVLGARSRLVMARERPVLQRLPGAITDNVNSSKQDSDLAQLMPAPASKHCKYTTLWVAVTYRWRPTMDTHRTEQAQETFCPASAATEASPSLSALDDCVLDAMTAVDLDEPRLPLGHRRREECKHVAADNRLTAEQLAALAPGDVVTIECAGHFQRPRRTVGTVVRFRALTSL